METSLAVRSLKSGNINGELIITSYCNSKGIPYIQYLMSMERGRINSIMESLGLSQFVGNFEDIVNIVNMASLVGWDVKKAQHFCKNNVYSDHYLKDLLKYVSGYELNRNNYQDSERYQYLSQFGHSAFICLYLVYTYYSRGIIEYGREVEIEDIYERVVSELPRIYEPYIINFILDQSSVFRALKMVPSGDNITYFLRSIPQYENIIKYQKVENTDESILSKYKVVDYLDHNDLVFKSESLEKMTS